MFPHSRHSSTFNHLKQIWSENGWNNMLFVRKPTVHNQPNLSKITVIFHISHSKGFLHTKQLKYDNQVRQISINKQKYTPTAAVLFPLTSKKSFSIKIMNEIKHISSEKHLQNHKIISSWHGFVVLFHDKLSSVKFYFGADLYCGQDFWMKFST